MAFLTKEQINEIDKKLSSDSITLKSIYRAKKNEFYTKSVVHSLVDEHLSRGWRVDVELKTKTKLIKDKLFSTKFEDEVWCQFFDLGFQHMNIDETLELPFDKDPKDKKQIDIVAIKDNIVFLIECKSSKKLKKAPSYKDEFDLLKLRLLGFKKSMEQLLEKKVRVKYVFATKNLRLDPEGVDFDRFNETRSFYYNDSTNLYISNLIKNYKSAAMFQFLGLALKNDRITDKRISIPAIEGDMGNKKYYMFSISPNILLKIGFVLHRAKANEAEFPTYQRLLKPLRLNGITKFIDEGGYFPNSIIVNFNSHVKGNHLIFNGSKKVEGIPAKLGVLEIPNAFAIAYIIDGQHRLYGYANSKYLESNTIPVVAFDGLESDEQLKMFMDINENQTKVSANLRLDLEEDLYWSSNVAASRLKALRSSIIKSLGYAQSGPLYNRISIGEEKRELNSKAFADSILKSGLLPTAKGNKYIEETTRTSLYDISNHGHQKEMEKCKKKIVKLLNLCYEFVESNYPEIYNRDRYFIVSDRGTYAFVTLIGRLNVFLSNEGKLNVDSSSQERFEAMERYLDALLKAISNLSEDEENKQLSLLGQGVETKWLQFFQTKVNDAFPDFNPQDLIEWKEKHDEELQASGLMYSQRIESHMKHIIVKTLKKAFDENWELEIAKWKRECEELASKEQEQNYKEGLGNEKVDWKTKFSVLQYKEIIVKFWSNMPPEKIEPSEQFQNVFAIEDGQDGTSKNSKVKWISQFNKYRNKIAHRGTNEQGLTKVEVDFLLKIFNFFELDEN